MRIVCPKCELKGQVDVTPVGAKTRIACVRCATTFEAVFADGEVQGVLPQANYAGAVIENAVGDVSASGAEFMSASAPETPRENQFDDIPEIEEWPVAADDFYTSSPNLVAEATVETAQDASQEISHQLMPPDVEAEAHEPADTGQDVVAQSLKSDVAGKVGRPPSDVYGMGVRLMRVSPVWLLVAGLSFISFIVFCNWLIKPTEQAGDAPSLIATANNHATNRAADRAGVPASTTQSTVNSQAAQPSKEPGVAFIEAEAREKLPPVAAPSVAAAGAKPAAEEKPATPPASSNRTDEAKEGKVTIQVGSYNAAAEAESRVANLKAAGFAARSVTVEIPKRGTWYRVQSGRFMSRDEAERYGKQLRDKGIVSSYITTDVQE
ncbi:MAG TPA: SPOR domain-containing protein [Pyrinomonadaceae bacterium]|nr:SPOR domain-containing protein [Pyrinomonadaceae bacterium]